MNKVQDFRLTEGVIEEVGTRIQSWDFLRGPEYRNQVPKEFIIFSQDMQNHWSANNLSYKGSPVNVNIDSI